MAAEDDQDTAKPGVLHACMMPSSARRLGTELTCQGLVQAQLKHMIFSNREYRTVHHLDQDRLNSALLALGDTLAFRGQSATIAVLGGSGLLLLGAVQRTTHDVDVVALVEGERLSRAEPLPVALREAARDVADALGLDPNWINPGPTSLLDFGLPANLPQQRWAYEVQHSFWTGLGMVEAGIGVIAVPALALSGRNSPQVISRPLVEPSLTRTVAVIRRRGVTLSPATQEFLTMLKKRWRQSKLAVHPRI